MTLKVAESTTQETKQQKLDRLWLEFLQRSGNQVATADLITLLSVPYLTARVWEEIKNRFNTLTFDQIIWITSYFNNIPGITFLDEVWVGILWMNRQSDPRLTANGLFKLGQNVPFMRKYAMELLAGQAERLDPELTVIWPFIEDQKADPTIRETVIEILLDKRVYFSLSRTNFIIERFPHLKAKATANWENSAGSTVHRIIEVTSAI